MKVTAEQHQQNLEALAKLTPEAMEGMTAQYLRKLLAGINVANITRDGEPLSTSRARKAELIEAIYTMTNKPRVLAQVELTELSPEDINRQLASLADATAADLADQAEYLYKQLREYTQGQWDVEAGQWRLDTQLPNTLGLALYAWLENYRTLEGKPLADSTKLRYASRIRNAVKQLIITNDAQSGYITQLMRHYEQMKTFNCKFLAEHYERSNEAQTEAAQVRRANSQAIDPSKLVVHAQQLLASITAGETPRWHDVSIALVLCTGRRPSEVHATAEFTVTGEYTLHFKGQLKKKGKASEATDDGFEIPTLAPAIDCVNALDYLTSKGKRYENDPEKAHKAISNEISKYGIKTWFDKYLPNVKDNIDDNTGKPIKVRTHHRMREIYALVALQRYEQDSERTLTTTDRVRFITSILGHEPGGTTYENYDANFYLSSEPGTLSA